MRMPARLPRCVRRAAARFAASRAANIATAAALFAPVALALAAVAVDHGALNVERRELQSLADLAAIAAASDLGRAEERALVLFADNGLDMRPVGAGSGASGTVALVRGRYLADGARPADQRFVAGAEPANAVMVEARKPGTLHFAGAWRAAPTIAVRAIAAASPEAAFSVGSRLARLDGGIANRLLAALTGSSVSLTVMDYDALLGADVDLLSFLDALNVSLGLQAASYDRVLDADLTLGRLATELASMEGIGVGARAALNKLASGLGGGQRSFRLRELIDAGALGGLPPGARPALSPRVGAMELVSTAAMVAVATGRHQVETDLGISVPGLLGAQATLTVGEPPQGSGWLRVGSGGEVVRTAQTRLLVLVRVDGPGGILGNLIRLPLYLELAYAEARLDGISCPTGRTESLGVRVAARPGIAQARISDVEMPRLTDFTRPVPVSPARLVTLPAVTVTAGAHVTVASPGFTALNFSLADIEAGRVRRVSTSGATQSLVSSLLGSLDVNVSLAGLDLGLGALLRGTVRTALLAVAPALDDTLESVLAALGLSLGEADIRVHGAHCGRAALVQ